MTSLVFIVVIATSFFMGCDAFLCLSKTTFASCATRNSSMNSRAVSSLLTRHLTTCSTYTRRACPWDSRYLHCLQQNRFNVETENNNSLFFSSSSTALRAQSTTSIGNDESTTKNNDSKDDGDAQREIRRDRLHFHLQEIGIDADSLEDAAFRSVATTDGFDARFGKSAIKAYRTYIDPRASKIDSVSRENVNVAANRCARQIDFLAKRHRSHEAEWVRHTDTVESKNRRIFPLILVLDNVRSAFNVGSIFRTADACGCLEIITTGITPHPGGNGAEKLSKSALGAERILPTRHFSTTQQALDYLRSERPRVMLVGMETTERSKIYTELQYPGSGVKVTNDNLEESSSLPGVALFLGNEVSGVDTDIMPLLDEVVEIPMFGQKNSLNVAACAPVVMYEILRQWGAIGKNDDTSS